MSGVFKGISKIFHAVGNVVGDVIGGIKHAVVTLWHNPIVRAAAIAVAAYFTAGAIAGAFSAAGGTTGAVAADTVGSAGSAIGGSAGGFFGGTMTAADITSGVGAMYGGAAADVAAAGATGLGIGATAATSALPDAIASGDVGFDIGTGATYATSATGEMDMAAFTGQGVTETSLLAGQPVETAVANGANVAASGVSPALGTQAANSVTGTMQDFTSNAFDSAQGTGGGFQSFEQSNGLLAASPDTSATGGAAGAAGTAAPSSPSLLQSIGQDAKNVASDIGQGISKVGTGVKDFLFGTPTAGSDVALGDTAVSTGTSGGLLSSSLSKEMLISGLMNIGSQLLAKPQPQMQFAGVKGNGSGTVTGIHTTNGGFGLAVGGSEPAPSGVPQSILPPGSPGLATAPATPQVASAAKLPTMPTLTPAPAPAGAA